jgi:NAD(P)-dependent dehydrogenase (short-subunit alcohol dehydrogenase family)
MDLELAGRTAVVTGASKGIGLAITRALAGAGAEVVAGAQRSSAELDELAAGGQVRFVPVNLADPAGPAALADAAGGRIDILVNNVGIGGGGDGPAHRADEQAFDRILGVNLKSAWMTIKHIVPVMREQGFGSIVNISSLASLAGNNQVAYEVSKAGMNRLTISVANANASHGLRCNAVLPGLMDTPMAISGIAEAIGSTTEAVREARNARVPLRGKMGTAWDTAHAALFLASDEANFITGVLLPVDGGMAARVG